MHSPVNDNPMFIDNENGFGGISPARLRLKRAVTESDFSKSQ